MPKIRVPETDSDLPISDEFAYATINDRRLVKRLCHTAEMLAQQPEKSISMACGPWHDVKAAYEMFDNNKVTCENMLFGHHERTVERMKAYETVLIVQDTTTVNYDTQAEGLGPVSDSVDSLGLLAHTALAVATNGVPLGVLSLNIWARDLAEHGKHDQRKEKATYEKESNKWLDTMDSSHAGVPAEIRTVTVCDRESDIFDFANKAVNEKRHLLFRVAQNRRVDSEHKKLFEQVTCTPVLGHCVIEVPRKAGSNQPPRQARLSIRTCLARINSPLKRAGEHLPPIALYAVDAREENAPGGTEPLHWLLLTTLPVKSLQDAVEKIGWYRQRWKIERFHFILKSGCKIEKLRLETSERLEKAITLYAVIAWRLAWITYQARVTPDMPCCAVFSQEEWRALWRLANPGKKPSDRPPSLKDAVLWLAKLGGFLGRKSDGNPGVKVLWCGLHHLNIGMRFLENS